MKKALYSQDQNSLQVSLTILGASTIFPWAAYFRPSAQLDPGVRADQLVSLFLQRLSQHRGDHLSRLPGLFFRSMCLPKIGHQDPFIIDSFCKATLSADAYGDAKNSVDLHF